MTAKLIMACTSCGGENVQSDAYVSWDVTAQEWTVDQTFYKGGHCTDCDGECSVESKVITDAEYEQRTGAMA